MVTESHRHGVIVSTSSHTTAKLDELVTACGWPIVRQATVQRLHRELKLGLPAVSLFWLDHECDVTSTTELLAWLGEYQPAVRRIAVGYRLPAETEVPLRCAGAQLYLVATDNLCELLQYSLPQEMRGARHGPPVAKQPLAVHSSNEIPAPLETNLHLSEPP